MFKWISRSLKASSPYKNNKVQKRLGKHTLRGVWTPVSEASVRTFASQDDDPEETKKIMKDFEWIPCDEKDQVTFNRSFVGDRYVLKESGSDDTEDTVASDDETLPERDSPLIKRVEALPRGPGAFGGCHILINKERVKRGINPLCRERILDEISANHAKAMAMGKKLRHTSIAITMKRILSSGPCGLVGENIGKGRNAQIILDRMMIHSAEDRNNVLDRRYSAFGVGSYKSDCGTLYIVQIFKG
mmetsp:Transcript_11421/g.12705  ORF Transcript_11421/g.12705 Transcript_11421/m.12705 type:complete len:245 (-) Transcript_11421:189-923(-)